MSQEEKDNSYKTWDNIEKDIDSMIVFDDMYKDTDDNNDEDVGNHKNINRYDHHEQKDIKSENDDIIYCFTVTKQNTNDHQDLITLD